MSGTQLVCIKKPEPGLSSIFENMYINERLVDVTLSCCDGQLQAHKLVLAACSPYFSGLFDRLANPFHYPVIIIKDMNIEDLRLIVDFMYKGQITVTRERFNGLIKCAENLQINGLTSNATTVTNNPDNNNRNSDHPDGNDDAQRTNAPTIQKYKKEKKKPSSSSNLLSFNRNYNHQLSPDKLLDQSMTTGDSIDGVSHFPPYTVHTNDPISTRNINTNVQHLHTPSPSAINITNQLTTDIQHHNLANQFMGQVLNHSLGNSRSSTTLAQTSSHHNEHHNSNQIGTTHQIRGRVHPCNICWKTFREKANLKRHLQVHSLDRIVYACPDCNKTFAWKDNYIRHTKTAHHLNNSRPQA